MQRGAVFSRRWTRAVTHFGKRVLVDSQTGAAVHSYEAPGEQRAKIADLIGGSTRLPKLPQEKQNRKSESAIGCLP